jgi:hypothetical protein
MVVTIFIALYLGEPYSNFMLGAIAGVLIYPLVEVLVYAYLAKED